MVYLERRRKWSIWNGDGELLSEMKKELLQHLERTKM